MNFSLNQEITKESRHEVAMMLYQIFINEENLWWVRKYFDDVMDHEPIQISLLASIAERLQSCREKSIVAA